MSSHSPRLAMEYLELRQLHVGFAIASVTLFCLRAALLLGNRPVPKVLRWLPHLNDTLLLAAAITLAVWSGQYPFQQAWLTAKVAALVVYILLGARALRSGLDVSQRLPWLFSALVTIAYIFAVALTKNPWPFNP